MKTSTGGRLRPRLTPPGKPLVWIVSSYISRCSRGLLTISDVAGVISREDGTASGLTPAHVQRSDKYGGGFFVNVEGMHHLHCLVNSPRISRPVPARPLLTGPPRILFGNPCTTTTSTTRTSAYMHSRTRSPYCDCTCVSECTAWA